MMLYRIHENLLYPGNKRIFRGSIHTLDKLSKKSISTLIARGRISMYRAPPLVELPGFKYRAKRLKKFEMDAIDLFSKSAKEISDKTGLSEKLVTKWKRELNEVLGINETVYKKDG